MGPKGLLSHAMSPSIAPCSPTLPFRAPLLPCGPCAGGSHQHQALSTRCLHNSLANLKATHVWEFGPPFCCQCRAFPSLLCSKTTKKISATLGQVLHAPRHPSSRDPKPQGNGGATTISHLRVCTAKHGGQLVSSPKKRCTAKFSSFSTAELPKGPQIS